MKNVSEAKTEIEEKEKVGTNPTSFFKRFLALLVDLLIVGVISACVELGMAKAFHVSEIKDCYNNSVTASNEYAQSTHLLASFDTIAPTDKGEGIMYNDWLNNQLSNEYTKENDCLYKYYIDFKKISIEEFNETVNKEEYKGIFVFDNKTPYRLSETSVENIRKYQNYIDLDKAEVTNTYNTVHKFFVSEYKGAWKNMLEDETYRSKINAMSDNMKQLKLAVGQSSLTSYSIVAFVYFSLLPFALRKGRTFGKLLCKIQVKTKNYENIKWHNILIRGISQTVIYSALLLYVPIMVLPQFWYQTNLFNFGHNSFSTLSQVVLSMILIIASLMMFSFRQDKAALDDYLSNTLTIDLSPSEINYKKDSPKGEIKG